MKKSQADVLSLCFLVAGILVLPTLEDGPVLQGRAMGFIGAVILLILLVRLVAFFTGYTPEERKEERRNLMALVGLWLVTLGLAFAGI